MLLLLLLLLLLQTSTYQPKNHAFFPSKRRDVSNLVADGYKTYTNMRIDRHMHTGCLWIARSAHSLTQYIRFSRSALFADVAVASPLLRYTSDKYMGIAFIATTIYFDCLTHSKRVERITKSYNIFHVENVNALVPLGISQYVLCFYVVTTSVAVAADVTVTVADTILWLSLDENSQLATQPLFPNCYSCVSACALYTIVYNAWEHYRVLKSKSWYLVAGGKLVKVSESSISC